LGIEEPGPARSVESGADLVTWSGDKLLGGPQAGIVHGSHDLVARLRANPLARAFRVDKMTLAALEATLQDYRDPERALERIPVLRTIGESVDSVAERAATALAAAPEGVRQAAEVREMNSVVGGGSLPGMELPSCGLAVPGYRPQHLDAACRVSEPPLVGRIERDTFLVDFRTLAPGEESKALEVLAMAIESAAAAANENGGGDSGG
jgi:L-seryl-tRNA(Ser) seleniumtransferase